MPDRRQEKFTPDNAAILLVDHQDAIVDWIHSLPRETTIANTRMLARLGADLGVPLLVTSTVEDQIGPNIKDIQDLAPDAFAQRVKRGGTLNCFLETPFAEAVRATGRRNLIMAGLTTDICLFHSAVGALDAGYDVQIVADACGSMSTLADDQSFHRLRRMGAQITNGLQILTELYPDFGTADGQRARAITIDEVISKLPQD